MRLLAGDWRLLIFLGLLCCCGCRDDSGEIGPPSNEALIQQELELPQLYLTEDGREIIAPRNSSHCIVDPETNTLAWEAWTCLNPDCPGEGKEGRPYLFTRPEPAVEVGPDGTVVRGMIDTDEELAAMGEYGDIKCPACLSIRDLESESEDTSIQYRSWPRLYELPGVAEQRAEIEEMRRSNYDRIRAAGGGPDKD